MELIDRYIHAVTHRLPVDIQADVSDELRSVIDEALEEKGSRSKKAIKEVLTELGNPAILATQYSGTPQFIVGPRFYPIYLQVLKMVLGIGLPIVVAISIIVQLTGVPTSPIEFILGAIGIIIGAAVQMLFWTTLVFFIVERSGASDTELRKNSGWTPDMLPTSTTKREIPISDGIADIVWYSLITVLPFIAQHLVGAHENGVVTPFFDSNVWTVGGPVLVVLGLLGVAKSILKLKLGQWTKSLAIFNTIYAITFSAVLVYAAVAISLVNPALLELLDTHIATSNLDEITSAVNWTIGISVAIFVGIYVYDAMNSLYRAYRQQMPALIK